MLVQRLGLAAFKFVSFGKAPLVAAMSVLVLVIPASQSPDPVLVTRAGEWHTFTFDDGSSVTMGPRSALSYEFDARQRLVRLTGGEALFKVAKDAQRPFLVQTPGGCARALGTIFSVSHQSRTTSVTTQEGIVGVSRLDEAQQECAGDGIRLFAGQKAVLESWTPLVARNIDASVEFAWTNREIVFTGQTAEEAVREFNRRNWVQLDLPSDPEIVRLRIMGRFKLDEPERFAHTLEKLRRSSAKRR